MGAFMEGYAAFPFEKRRGVSFSTSWNDTYDEGYCPYVRPNGARWEPRTQRSDWAQWWRGYRMAAAEDEVKFLTTKEYK